MVLGVWWKVVLMDPQLRWFQHLTFNQRTKVRVLPGSPKFNVLQLSWQSIPLIRERSLVRVQLRQPNKGVPPQGEAADCNSVAETHVGFDSLHPHQICACVAEWLGFGLQIRFMLVRVQSRTPNNGPIVYAGQDTRLSIWRNGFDTRWGYQY